MFNSAETPARYLDVLSVMLEARLSWLTYDEFERIISYLQQSKHGVTTSNHMYGNWYDANAYCLERNSSLAAHTLGLLNHRMDGWMDGVLGHFYALPRLNWAGDNLD